MQPRLIRRVSAAALAGVVSVVLLSGSLLAHHGWGGNSDAEFELTGTVEVPLKIAGPHATMKIKADGKVWDLTLSPPGQTSASGLTEGLIPVGATVKVHGHRNKDANRLEIKTERITFNNKVYNVYPNRD